MGYTPQLLCGTWTGCDDRFIRFSNTNVGQGSSVALPIWAYFYKKISADKNLAIDTKSVFVKPEMMHNDVIYDWVNDMPQQLGAEGEDAGNGSEEDYGGADQQPLPPAQENQYDIQPESQVPPDTSKKKNTNTITPKAVMPPKRPA